MSISEIEAGIIKLAREEVAFEASGNRTEARRVMVEWCMIRDGLSGSERERCINLTVAVKVQMSSEALRVLKEQDPPAYLAYKDLEEFAA